MRPSSRRARAGMLASSSPPSSRLELGPLDREPVGVGRDHRHLGAAAATKTPVSTGRMSSREAARATRSMLGRAPRPASQVGSPAAAGSFGKSSAGSTRRWKLRAAAVDLDVVLGLARLDLHLASPSERATSASSRPGRRAVPSSSTSASSVVSQAEVEIGGGERQLAPAGGEENAREGLGGGAGGYGSRDDRELGDEFFTFGRELQKMIAFLSWSRSC